MNRPVQNVTIRGATDDFNDVVIRGAGMDVRQAGTDFGISVFNAQDVLIANLSVGGVWYHVIDLQGGQGAERVRLYHNRLFDAGEQIIKSNPGGGGVDDVVVEYNLVEYTNGPSVIDHGGGTGYSGGIHGHETDRWIIRDNLWRNFHTPDTVQHTFPPTVLMWNYSADTVVERNTFVDTDRAVAFGLVDRADGFDHRGGVIRNNFVYQRPGLFSAGRRAASDGQLLAYDSPGTVIAHNTVLTNGNSRLSLETRWGAVEFRNNLTDAPMGARDGGTYTGGGNYTAATPDLFVNPAAADLHLKDSPAARAAAIDRAGTLNGVAVDWDAVGRPSGPAYDVGADEFKVPSGFSDDFSSSSPHPAWTFVGPTWSQAGGVLSQTSSAAGDPKKAVVTGRAWTPDQEVVASVRVNEWAAGDYARAGVGVRTDAQGLGYNLLFHGDNTVQFLNDHVAWGNAFTFAWQVGTWYRFKLRAEGDLLLGKVWAAGQSEPAAWMFTQAGWTGRTGGAPAVNGGSSGAGWATASFDDFAAVDLTGGGGDDGGDTGPLFQDDFSSSSPGSAWSFSGGSWSQGGGVLAQTSTADGDPKKAVVSGIAARAALEVEARVRVDTWAVGDYARAGVGIGTDSSGRGYNLVFHGQNKVQFLNDHVAWGNAFDFTWQAGVWYRFKLRQEADGTLRGKVWADGQAEPGAWQFTQSGWSARVGYASLNGGSAAAGQGSATASFDDVVVRRV